MAGSSARHRSTQALPAFVPPHSVLWQLYLSTKTPVPYPGKAGCLMVTPTGFGFCQSLHSNPVSLCPGSQANESTVLHVPLRHLQGWVSNNPLSRICRNHRESCGSYSAWAAWDSTDGLGGERIPKWGTRQARALGRWLRQDRVPQM